mmetsp:Transcript_86292/g.140082  ORF Transcript_86292/g.140082 Transcript_86292/m.140082 type:complete len:207 (+) Transcript_86292:67-687(+)
MARCGECELDLGSGSCAQCSAAAAAALKAASGPLMTAEQAPYVEMETSIGTIVFELYWQYAPLACQNFASLAARGYYQGIKFHRVVPGFMIQGGDPTGTGKGGQSIYGKHFKDEFHPALGHRGAGVVSMANTGVDANSSQFFISLAPLPWVDGGHTIFARIARGIMVVKKMGQVVTDDDDNPKCDLLILNAVPLAHLPPRQLKTGS